MRGILADYERLVFGWCLHCSYHDLGFTIKSAFNAWHRSYWECAPGGECVSFCLGDEHVLVSRANVGACATSDSVLRKSATQHIDRYR
jgi:hypothetical protein